MGGGAQRARGVDGDGFVAVESLDPVQPAVAKGERRGGECVGPGQVGPEHRDEGQCVGRSPSYGVVVVGACSSSWRPLNVPFTISSTLSLKAAISLSASACVSDPAVTSSCSCLV